MNKNDIQKWIKPALCGLCLILTGCSAASLARESTFESSFENGGEEEAVNIYTSDASVIIEGTNEQEQTITVHLIHKNESRTLSYNGATLVWDKYGSAMTMAQLRAGDIADISYNSELEKVGSVSLSEKAWSYEGIDRYILDAGNGSAAIGDEMYSIGENVMVFSDGEIIDTSRIIRHDVLTFHGMDHNIMSITVDKGHGYLDLENEDAILGGWIEIGQAVISQVAPDMLLTVPEGNYTVRLTADGVDETREVTIERNKETVLNLEDIEIPEPEDGVVIFEITPTPSAVYVDDKKVETKYPLRLPLGLHQVTAEASGYETLSQYFEVEGKSTTVKMNLAERASVSGNNITETKEEEEKKTSTVTIDLPNGVEVYQDNLYMGIAPVTYDKTPGDHTITLRKSGYITRSYSINIADDDKDVTYSFPDLDPESSNNTVSGNTVSGNTANEDKNKNEDRKDSSKDHGSTGNQGNSGSQGSTGSNDNTGGSGNSGAEEGDHDNTVSGNTISGNTLDEDSDA